MPTDAASAPGNGLKARMRRGESMLNGWMMVSSGFSAELLGHAGFDSLTIDMQHGMIDFPGALAMLTALSATPTVPLVRVPWLDPGLIMKSLDAGAHGVICPMVNTAAEAEQLVAATRYAPRGNRSWGPMRASLYQGDYLRSSEDTVLNFAMIETRQAVENIDAICAVPGLDAVYIGPADLSLSLTGKITVDTLDGEPGDAIRHIVARARAHGVMPCTHTSTVPFARRMVEMGFSLVTCSNDVHLLTRGAAAVLAEMRA
jgi:4-hydroxy-2-oxoheptanedioate aldolase